MFTDMLEYRWKMSPPMLAALMLAGSLLADCSSPCDAQTEGKVVRRKDEVSQVQDAKRQARKQIPSLSGFQSPTEEMPLSKTPQNPNAKRLEIAEEVSESQVDPKKAVEEDVAVRLDREFKERAAAAWRFHAAQADASRGAPGALQSRADGWQLLRNDAERIGHETPTVGSLDNRMPSADPRQHATIAYQMPNRASDRDIEGTETSRPDPRDRDFEERSDYRPGAEGRPSGDHGSRLLFAARPKEQHRPGAPQVLQERPKSALWDEFYGILHSTGPEQAAQISHFQELLRQLGDAGESAFQHYAATTRGKRLPEVDRSDRTALPPDRSWQTKDDATAVLPSRPSTDRDMAALQHGKRQRSKPEMWHELYAILLTVSPEQASKNRHFQEVLRELGSAGQTAFQHYAAYWRSQRQARADQSQ